MNVINKLYGVLKGDTVISKDMLGYRFSNAVPTDNQRSKLAGLLDSDATVRALQIDCLIRLLQCSPWWPDFERQVDPVNTYTVPVTILSPDTNMSHMTGKGAITALVRWSDNHALPNTGIFSCSENDPELDKACAKLFGVIAGN